MLLNEYHKILALRLNVGYHDIPSQRINALDLYKGIAPLHEAVDCPPRNSSMSPCRRLPLAHHNFKGFHFHGTATG